MTEERSPIESSRLASRRVGPEESPVSALIEAATSLGIDVIDRTELNDIIDPDALNLLFGPRLNGEPRYGGSTVFEAWGFLVHVTRDRVDLYPDDVPEEDILRAAATRVSTPPTVPSDPRVSLNDD